MESNKNITSPLKSKHVKRDQKEERKQDLVLYQPFYDQVKEFYCKHQKEIQQIPVESLGNGISDVANYYFKESKLSIKVAQEFFELFYADPRNKDFMINLHHEKYESLKKKEAIAGGCISFVVVNLPNLLHNENNNNNNSQTSKLYCLIAISGDSVYGAQLKDVFGPTIAELNSRHNDIEYVYLGGDIINFNNLLKKLGAPEYDIFKPCAEKFIGTVIFKLLTIFKEACSIVGGVNCCAFPREHGKTYGKPNSDDKTILPLKSDDKFLTVQNHIVIARIPCCSTCADNKKAVFKVWKGAPLLTPYAGDAPTSPIANSFLIRSPTMQKILELRGRELRMEASIALEQKQKEKNDQREAAKDEDGFTPVGVSSKRKHSQKATLFAKQKPIASQVTIEELSSDREGSKEEIVSATSPERPDNDTPIANDEIDVSDVDVSPIIEVKSSKPAKNKTTVRRKTTVTTTKTTTQQIIYSSSEEGVGTGPVLKKVEQVVVTKEEETIIEETETKPKKRSRNKKREVKKPEPVDNETPKKNSRFLKTACMVATSVAVFGVFATAAIAISRPECFPDLSPTHP